MTSQEKLFNYYCQLQSKEMREEITGFKPLKMKNKRIAIKVIFNSGDWLHLFQNLDGSVEWY